MIINIATNITLTKTCNNIINPEICNSAHECMSVGWWWEIKLECIVMLVCNPKVQDDDWS